MTRYKKLGPFLFFHKNIELFEKTFYIIIVKTKQ